MSLTASEIADIASENTIAPLAKYYRQPALEEVCVNRWGEIWIKRSAHDWECIQDPAINERTITLLLQNLANRRREYFDPIKKPILYTDTMDGARLSAMIGANCRYRPTDQSGIALAIRPVTHIKRGIESWNFTEDATFESLQGSRHARNHEWFDRTNIRRDLIMAVENEGAVCISGAMSTGKTRFLEAVLGHIPLNKRIVEAADVSELDIPHPNHITLVTSRTEAVNGITWLSILDFMKRATPDYPICQEVSAKNGDVVYQLMNMGLPFFCTVHANSASEAIKAIYQNVANCNPQVTFEVATQIIMSAFARIVQLEKTPEGRRVVDYKIPAELIAGRAGNALQQDYNRFRSNSPEDRAAEITARVAA